MEYVLFIAERKKSLLHAEEQNWRNFVGIAEDILAGIEGDLTLPQQGVILLRLSAGMRPLAKLVRLASDYQIQSRCLFFESKPSWVITPIE